MSGRRVLLVIDDDDPVREVVCSCFEDVAGWRVISVSSGKIGLQIAQSEQIDAIILDAMMPEMDGKTFLQQLRNQSKTQRIPVIILTAIADSIEPEEFADLEIAGIIAKPFDPLLLTQQVANLLNWT